MTSLPEFDDTIYCINAQQCLLFPGGVIYQISIVLV